MPETVRPRRHEADVPERNPRLGNHRYRRVHKVRRHTGPHAPHRPRWHVRGPARKRRRDQAEAHAHARHVLLVDVQRGAHLRPAGEAEGVGVAEHGGGRLGGAADPDGVQQQRVGLVLVGVRGRGGSGGDLDS